MIVYFSPHLWNVVKMMTYFAFEYFRISIKDTFSFYFTKLTPFEKPLQKALLMNITRWTFTKTTHNKRVLFCYSFWITISTWWIVFYHWLIHNFLLILFYIKLRSYFSNKAHFLIFKLNFCLLIINSWFLFCKTQINYLNFNFSQF